MTTSTEDWTGIRALGTSGMVVSALGFGGWAIGGAMASGTQQLGYAGVDDVAARAAVLRAVERGITLFDTADAYGAGHSETLLGDTIGRQADLRIATKFGNTIDEASRQLTGTDVSPEYIRRAVQDSLCRLRRERIDLYQLHHSDVTVDQAEDIAEELERLVVAGHIAWWGVSTDDPAIADRFAPARHCTAMQLQLNVLDDNAAMLELCEQHDLGVLVRSPLAMGLLGGRYDSASRLPADDIRGKQPEWLTWFSGGRPDPVFLDRIAAVRDVLTADGRTLAQGALAWIWARDPRAVPLVGCRNEAQVMENAGALTHGPLDPQQFAAVESALGLTTGDD